MRNNAKLKKLLKCADIAMTSEDDKIEMVVTEKNQLVSFIVKSSSITGILNDALKLIQEIGQLKKQKQ